MKDNTNELLKGLINTEIGSTKKCKVCGEIKPTNDFYKGYAVCKICYNKAEREHRQRAVQQCRIDALNNSISNGFKRLPSIPPSLIEELCENLEMTVDKYKIGMGLTYKTLMVILEDAITAMDVKFIYQGKSYTMASAKASNRMYDSRVHLDIEEQDILDTILDDNIIGETLKDNVCEMLSFVGQGENHDVVQMKDYASIKALFRIVIGSLK